MKRLLLLLLPGLLLACQSSRQPDPLPFSQMEEVMLQLHLADVYIDNNSGPLLVRQQSRYQQYLEVLQGMQVDTAHFWASYDYYLAHPVLLDSMYGRMVDRMNQMTVDEAARNVEQKRQAVSEPVSEEATE